MPLPPVQPQGFRSSLDHTSQPRIHRRPEGLWHSCRPSAQGSCGEQPLLGWPRQIHQRLRCAWPASPAHRAPHHTPSLNAPPPSGKQVPHRVSCGFGYSGLCSQTYRIVLDHILQRHHTCLQCRQSWFCCSLLRHHRDRKDHPCGQAPEPAPHLHTGRDTARQQGMPVCRRTDRDSQPQSRPSRRLWMFQAHP